MRQPRSDGHDDHHRQRQRFQHAVPAKHQVDRHADEHQQGSERHRHTDSQRQTANPLEEGTGNLEVAERALYVRRQYHEQGRQRAGAEQGQHQPRPATPRREAPRTSLFDTIERVVGHAVLSFRRGAARRRLPGGFYRSVRAEAPALRASGASSACTLVTLAPSAVSLSAKPSYPRSM